MLLITGTLWGWVEARPGRQGLMAVVSQLQEECGCSAVGAPEQPLWQPVTAG